VAKKKREIDSLPNAVAFCSKATCGGKSGVGLEQQKEEKRRGPKKRIR
jgi:hypothetical protein